MSASSSSSTEGFRLERKLGAHVHEAVQLELGRRVALRRLPPGARFQADAWPDHPNVLPLYAAGETWIATRMLPGARTLAEHRGTASPAWLADAEAALAAAHAAGIVHGRLTADQILIDGQRAYVAGWGLAPPGATPEEDRAALARLRAMAGSRRPARRRNALAALTLATTGLAALLALLGGEDAKNATPPVTRGAQPLGSALAPAGVRSVDCDGAAPSGSSPACTIVQTRLAGRAVTAPADGVVRAWVVRGVRGRVRLQIVRHSGDGYRVVGSTEAVAIDDPAAVRSIAAAMPIERGDLVALEVEPGTAVGLRGGVAGAETTRFFGPLRAENRTPDPEAGAGRREEELMLRVDVAAEG